MKSLSPIVWFEGMHLGPHQFQAQNRYFQHSIHFAASALWTANYGLIGGELSAEALANGQALLLHARGIFPDGLPFDMPVLDSAPAARDLSAAFPLTENKTTVFLAIPPDRHNARNYSLDGAAGGGTRFVSEMRPLCDETTGLDERPVPLGRKNIRLLLGTEDASDLVGLPIARVVRSGAGGFTLDPSFIPPCLDITASPRLLSLLGRLVQLLEDRTAALSLSATEQPGKAPRDLARFWFLHTINSSLAPLKHLYSVRRGHPEELFLEMSRLAGALCTYALDSHPRSLPLYDHMHLDECFNALDLHIRRHLEIILPENCLHIPLTGSAQYLYRGDILDQRCLGSSSWILAVRGGGAENEVIANVPVLVKMCSEQFVPELVRRALPGFVLTHLPTPPPAVSIRADTQYFQVSKGGPCWEHIKKTRQVGLYIPGDIPNPELELLVVID
jgi:type VI secretion system protein ImpJ